MYGDSSSLRSVGMTESLEWKTRNYKKQNLLDFYVWKADFHEEKYMKNENFHPLVVMSTP